MNSEKEFGRLRMAMVIASFKVVCYSDIYLEGARKDA
jgi:hypothetical protein